MNRYGKIVGIIFGLLLFAVLAFNIIPVIGTAMNAHSTQPITASAIADDPGVLRFENFLSDLNSAERYSICCIKSIIGQGPPYNTSYFCTVSGNDYAIRIDQNEHAYRQLYKNGKFTLVDDTAQAVYPGVQTVSFPVAHFREALGGKPIAVGGEIINGNHTDRVELYKNGMVYAFYFNQQGGLARFYYIYDTDEVTLDFCSFIIGNTPSSVSFDVPDSYVESGSPPDIT